MSIYLNSIIRASLGHINIWWNIDINTSDLLSHMFCVDLAHVAATVSLLYVPDMQIPNLNIFLFFIKYSGFQGGRGH